VATVNRPERAGEGRPSVLIVSNGHGEDAVGMALADRLQPEAAITAFPLVGVGGAYNSVELLEPRHTLPSGGFALRGAWRALRQDLRSGAVRRWLAQRATLRGQHGRHRVIVAIGDVYGLWMAAAAGRPVVFVATAKSQYNEPHRALERAQLRRVAQVIFTRDELTAQTLHRTGLPARYVGNPLMDTIGGVGTSLKADPAQLTVLILPGSRSDADANLVPLLQVCAQIGARLRVHFVCALAPAIDLTRVRSTASAAGWDIDEDGFHRNGIRVTLTRAFGDAIRAADVVVGLAGTANEQAAGLGKPVVTFVGPGAQVSPRFVALQERLLGGALVVTRDWKDAAEAVVRLLGNPAERTARGAVGRERMGEPGAVPRIAHAILDLVNRPTGIRT
jgi:tetraacyldisaccharide 4'-kinase